VDRGHGKPERLRIPGLRDGADWTRFDVAPRAISRRRAEIERQRGEEQG